MKANFMENNNGIYLLQRKNSIIKKCILLFLKNYMLMLIMLFVCLKLPYYFSPEDNSSLFEYVSLEMFLLIFPYFVMIILVAMFFNCNNKVEINIKNNTLIVNDIEHKISKTNAIKFLLHQRELANWTIGDKLKNTACGKYLGLTGRLSYNMGIIIYTIENNKKVGVLSLPKDGIFSGRWDLPYIPMYNFNQKENIRYDLMSLILIFLTMTINIILALVVTYIILQSPYSV